MRREQSGARNSQTRALPFALLLLLLFAALLGAWLWASSRPRLARPSPTKAPLRAADEWVEAVEAAPASSPRLFVLAINGGGSPRQNYQSHLGHLQGLVDILRASGVPEERITVLAGDGGDPGLDLMVGEAGVGPEGWRLRGTAVEDLFSPQAVMGNSAVNGAKLYPATRGALSIWLLTVGQQLRAGDTLLLYVTDHGSKGKTPEDNRIVLWGADENLSVGQLREAFETLDPTVRVVALMSQCYSGGFAILSSLGGSAGEPTGRFCGFFSTLWDLPAYGCYPQTRDKPKVGHSFAFLQALPAAAGNFASAHALVLERDDAPDVPVRTSDLYLGRLLARAARAEQILEEQFVDDLLARAWQQGTAFEIEAQRLDRLAARFGLPSPRSLATLAEAEGFLPKVTDSLDRVAEDLNTSLEEQNRKELRRFLDNRPDMQGSLAPAALKPMDPAERMRLGATLAADLSTSSLVTTGAESQISTKQARDDLKQLAHRMRVRAAVLFRMQTMLESVAGREYLDRRAAEQASLRRLLDCEDLDLRLPRTEWAEMGPAFPPLADDLAQAQTILARATTSSLLDRSPLRGGRPAPELQLVPYRGDLPQVGVGKPVLLFFWATWCKACKASLPELLALAAKRDLTVLAISDDTEPMLDHFFARDRPFPSLVSRDPGRQTMFRFGINSLPSFVLLDAQGRVASAVVHSVRELPSDGEPAPVN